MDCASWWGPGFHGFWVVPLIFMLAMLVVAVLMVRRVSGWRGGDDPHQAWGPPFGGWAPSSGPKGRWPETPGQILDRRYASGEITKEQYEQIRADLGPGQPRP